MAYVCKHTEKGLAGMKVDACVGCMVPQFCVVVFCQVVVFIYLNLAQTACYNFFRRLCSRNSLNMGVAFEHTLTQANQNVYYVDNTAESETCC